MKVIQVGIGGMGNAWLRTVQNSSEVGYSGFVEINPTIADQQAKQYNLNPELMFDSLKTALATVSADAIINVTPPQFHEEVALAALEAGIPVLSEKPLAHTLLSAQAIVKKSTDTGVLLMIAQNYRYRIPTQTVKQVLDSGKLGKIGSIDVKFYKGPHFGGFRDEMPYPLIIDMAIHHFDLMRFFLGSNPLSIYGRSWNPPWSWYKGDACASVSLEFANKVPVAYNGSWCSSGRETSWNGTWRFECEKGIVMLEDDQVVIYPRSDELLDLGGYSAHKTDAASTITPVTLPNVEQAYLLHEFYQAVTNSQPVATTCQDNIKSLAIVFDAVKSFETGNPMSMDV